VDELVARVATLQAASDWWTNAVLVLGIIAAVVAAVIGLTAARAQYMKNWTGIELTKAQKALAAYEDEKKKREAEILARPRDRRVSIQALIEASKGKPKAKLVILVQPADPEAYKFGAALSNYLAEAGWGMPPVSQIPSDLLASRYATWPPDRVAPLPPVVRAGAGTLETAEGVVVVPGPRTSPDEPQPASTLITALRAALIGIPVVGTAIDTGLPPDTIRLIIAPK